MYLDTKNMDNENSTNMTYARLNANKSKGRMGKVWRPLLRFLSLKSSHQTMEGKKKHPNNINLNNAAVHETHNENHAELIVELPQKNVQVDEELEQWHEEQKYLLEQLAAKEAEVGFIKSASIEKSPTYICQNCIHGRNCQHQLPHATLEKFQVTTTPDDMTIGWNEREGQTDNELLNAWYYYNYRQTAALQASLC